MVVRKDRADKVGGGVCAFISNKMRCLELDLCNLSADLDIVCFDIVMKSDKYRFIVFYRRPKEGLLGRVEAEALCNALQVCTAGAGATTTFILTDLNCPNVDWNRPMQCGKYVDRLFVNFMLSNGFTVCDHAH